ncbi:hypothetical protein JXO59_14405 [candidate division KSB1 bacterium]|nr:hypothetical protein [candidate division KSB1 bacterium]
MAEEMYTAAKMAKALHISDTVVKKTLKELRIEPDAKKGACSYYGAATLEKIKRALKK